MPRLTEPASPSPECLRARRQRIAARMVDDSALLLHGGQLRRRSNDTEHRFRPDSNFFYLSGLEEPGGLLLLRPGRDPEYTLFVRPRDPTAEIWTGRRVGPEGARESYGADAAWPLHAVDDHLRRLLDGISAVYVPFDDEGGLAGPLRGALGQLRRRERYGEQAPEHLLDARALLGEDRLVKDAAALACLRRAVDISARGHLAAIRAARPGLDEFAIEALLEFHFRRLGAAGPGYTSIVGAGDNATVLHYTANSGRLLPGDLLLIDAGAEWELFTGDITRTLPISGRFSGAQRDLYDVVLAANEAEIAAARVGATIDGLYRLGLRILLQGLRDLGLVDGEVDALVDDESQHLRYTRHRHSHWLGADVHDLGHYCIHRQARPLAPGHVLTVEPGLYIAADDPKAPPALRGLGIRIEDDVLIREGGPEVLSAAVPKAVAELEAMVGSEPYPTDGSL